MLSSHRFLCLPLCLPPWTVPCRTVLTSALAKLLVRDGNSPWICCFQWKSTKSVFVVLLFVVIGGFWGEGGGGTCDLAVPVCLKKFLGMCLKISSLWFQRVLCSGLCERLVMGILEELVDVCIWSTLLRVGAWWSSGRVSSLNVRGTGFSLRSRHRKWQNGHSTGYPTEHLVLIIIIIVSICLEYLFMWNMLSYAEQGQIQNTCK